ncbi:MAG: toprim domain-containing protein [Candidatus Paceibacterota bacterium]
MSSVDKLIEIFRNFPGIGPRQAKRFVYYLLTRNAGTLEELSRLILELKKEIKICGSCYRFFSKDASKSSLCEICRDEHRDKTFLMIVSKDVDLETIEKSHSYSGLYFVIGGSIPILEKEPDKQIRGKELLLAIEKKVAGGLKEIILALNLNPEGENTSDYLEKLLSPIAVKNNIKISTLGRGLSTGTELEYSDADTIKNAFRNRE